MTLKKRDLLKYVGDVSQLFGIKDYHLNGGKAAGTRAIDLKNGSGLDFTVLPDRGMDIAWTTFKGVNLSYISNIGIVAPQYFNECESLHLRSFYAGLLTTCTFKKVGSEGNDTGEGLGMDARISNTPAEEVSVSTEWMEEIFEMKVKGRVKKASFFEENIILTREISCRNMENKITIDDTFENYGFRKEPLMLLYHFNLGYPLLDENAYLIVPSKEVIENDEEAGKGIDSFHKFQKPTPDYKGQVFYHSLKSDKSGNTFAALINEKLELGIAFLFNKNQLFNLTQWKQLGEGEYVLGIEPCNFYIESKEDSRREGVLEYLEPGEVRKFRLEIEIIDGMKEINRLKNKISSLDY